MVEWTGLDWNGMAGCNFVIKFCGRDQTLTRVHRPWPCPLATMHQCNVTLCVKINRSHSMSMAVLSL